MAMNVFLWLSNGIKGESQELADYIDVLSWSWGATQSATSHMGTGSGGGKVSVQDLVAVKYVDLSTSDLIKRCSNGEHIDTGHMIVRKAGGAETVDYLRIDMEQIIISSYQTGGGQNDPGDKVQETMSMNFRSFAWTYTAQEGSGAAGTEMAAGWDIAANVPWTA